MKRKILFALSIFVTLFSFVGITAFAGTEDTVPSEVPSIEPTEVPSVEPSEENTITPSEEPTIPIEPITPEEPEEKVTFDEMVKDFADKWLGVILNALSGMTGCSISIAIATGIIKKLKKRLEDSANLTEADRVKINDDLKNATNILNDSQMKFDNAKNELETAIPKMKEEFSNAVKEYSEEVQALQNIVQSQIENFDTFRELFAILISQTPELAKNGIATKILEVLSKKEVSEDEQD